MFTRRRLAVQKNFAVKKEARKILPYFLDHLFQALEPDQLETIFEELYDQVIGIKSDPISNDEAEWIDDVLAEVLEMLESATAHF